MRLLVFLVIICSVQWVSAQRGNLLVIITDEDGNGIPGTVLRLTGVGDTAILVQEQQLLIPDLKPGYCTIRVTAPEMDTITGMVEIRVNQTVQFKEVWIPVSEMLSDVVVTGTRTDRRRTDSPVAVNVLDAATLRRTQSVCLSEGLAYQPGLRTETDCQTCNYTQLRMNGLGGSYTQILINGKPLFSSLMGLYGLEQIPSGVIDRVEVVRGSGSVLYGSNAIAGTVNILTRLPKSDEMAVSTQTALIGGTSCDWSANASLVSVNDSATAGFTLFSALRNRQSLDVNKDGFSEIPEINGVTLGASAFFKLKPRHTLEWNAYHIHEERRGGNALDLRPDQADQAEYRLQNTGIGQLSYTWKPRGEKWFVQAFTGGQLTRRTHYTGVDHADGWGNTRNLTTHSGIQVNLKITQRIPGRMTLTGGAELQTDMVHDQIPGYHFLIDQTIRQTGLYLQSDWELTSRWTLLSGVRLNVHSLLQQPVVTPRINLLYKPTRNVQLRAGYGEGFKAPQAFETDMHIAFASGGVSTISRAPDLKSETSRSLSCSLDWNRSAKRTFMAYTVSAFYTLLSDVFVLTEIGQDTLGNTKLLRKNDGNARVYGLTFEARLKWRTLWQADAGFTWQQSRYSHPVAWSDSVVPVTQFLRTPDTYGFLNFTLWPEGKWSATWAMVYTGSMWIPHFGGAPENPHDRLIRSKQFTDCTLRLSRTIHLHAAGQNIEFAAGIQNIFNQYQSDFDTGKYRDSNYIYGPAKPRTFFVALKWYSDSHR